MSRGGGGLAGGGRNSAPRTETLLWAQPCWRPSLSFALQELRFATKLEAQPWTEMPQFTDSPEASVSDRQGEMRSGLPLAGLNLQQTIYTKQPTRPTSQAALGGGGMGGGDGVCLSTVLTEHARSSEFQSPVLYTQDIPSLCVVQWRSSESQGHPQLYGEFKTSLGYDTMSLSPLLHTRSHKIVPDLTNPTSYSPSC